MAMCLAIVRAADAQAVSQSDTQVEPAAIQDIVVTGTRIKAPNLSNDSPITVGAVNFHLHRLRNAGPDLVSEPQRQVLNTPGR